MAGFPLKSKLIDTSDVSMGQKLYEKCRPESDKGVSLVVQRVDFIYSKVNSR